MSSPVTGHAEIFTDTSPDDGAVAAAAGVDLGYQIEKKQEDGRRIIQMRMAKVFP